MKLSDAIADMILNMFDDNTSTIQIQRNDLAQQLGCVHALRLNRVTELNQGVAAEDTL